MAVPRPEATGYSGMANLAHAIRRSTALRVAMEITTQGSSVEDMLSVADRLAEWLTGSAEKKAAEAAEAAAEGKQPLGRPWQEVLDGEDG